MVPCESRSGDPASKWEWIPGGPDVAGSSPPKGLLKHTSSDKCLIPDGDQAAGNLKMASCEENNDVFLWTFDYDQDHRN